MSRKPMPRTGGKYAEEIEGREKVAEKVVDELCELNPDIDVIDIEHQFMHSLAYYFARKIAFYSCGDRIGGKHGEGC